MKLLELQNLCVGFEGKKILNDLNGSIEAGELVALMGINGVGKSCLLKSILGINEIISGHIKLEGQNLLECSELFKAQNLSAVLTKNPHMDYLRVDEIVALGRSPHVNFWGRLTSVDKKIIQEVLEILGIEELKNIYFDQLSDGQKQKVLLARALAQRPKLLILDEPTTFLDIPSKIELMRILKKISKEQSLAILLSTHDLNLIETNADKIWLIEKEGAFIIKSPEDMIATGLIKKNFNV